METLLEKMVKAKQLSSLDRKALSRIYVEAEPENEGEVLQWLAKEYSLAYSDLSEIKPDAELLSLFPAQILLKREMLPISRTNGTVDLAVSRLYDTEGLDSLKTLTNLKFNPVLAPSDAIQTAMKKHLGVGADTLGKLEEDSAIQVIQDDADEDIDLNAAVEDASIIKFVNQVLTDAISLRATDIHLEPFEDEMRIRYRIDGVLQDVPVPAQLKRYQPAIVSRVKILSHLDIAEKRLPQDGRIKVRLEGNEVDIRVSLIPMLHGEAVVMRLLRQSMTLLGVAELHMADHDRRLFENMLDVPHGIILVTGPTGSGKTTTLYSALSEINDSVRKIITIEDPVEYYMKGINQIQVSEKTGLTFARGLRSILRHDPDVVLIGEIRDSETAQIAVQASLTGHLVFSTLHTNDAPGALTRLVDMGVEPFLVASALEAVLAQRLVRLLCPHCKAEDNSSAGGEFKKTINLDPSVTLYKAAGCEECRNTGYFGRRAVFEVMGIGEKIQQLVLKSKSSGEIRVAAQENGMNSLSEDGWRLVAEGVTTPDEVLRVTKDERMHNYNSNGKSKL